MKTIESTSATEDLPPMVSPSALAEFLQVSIPTLARWRGNKTGPRWVRVGGQAVRYPRENVRAWLDENEQAPADSDL
ncbi:helix-turn-helix transcriptional regulator [Leifsonia aquatica]|uniref:helix-turn-helix transcriptional regulator n=1 Tax=Leifsonia aquatica TaxID=144185 RepID=UPI00046988BA|nr:helix-turn-helix domain-containing protein [Leifsonia aquatica]